MKEAVNIALGSILTLSLKIHSQSHYWVSRRGAILTSPILYGVSTRVSAEDVNEDAVIVHKV